MHVVCRVNESLNVQVSLCLTLVAIVSDHGELALQQRAVGGEPLVRHLLVLRLAGEEVQEVDHDTHDHDDLHVVVLPVSPGVMIDRYLW